MNPVFFKLQHSVATGVKNRGEALATSARERERKAHIGAESGLIHHSNGQHGLDLKFFSMNDITYRQFKGPFVANLSAIDVLMFNSVAELQALLPCYSLHSADRPTTGAWRCLAGSRKTGARLPSCCRLRLAPSLAGGRRG